MEFEPGKIKLRFHSGYYDGMLSGVGILHEENKPVYLSHTSFGGWELKKEYSLIQDKLDDLDDGGKGSDEIWDFFERKLGDEMYEDTPRVFNVYELEEDLLKKTEQEHQQFQLHVGMHCDYRYKDGKPSRRPDDFDSYWGLSNEYHKAHYYDQDRAQNQVDCSKLKLLGEISYRKLFEAAGIEDVILKDVRSDELKAYQEKWVPGDEIKINWT